MQNYQASKELNSHSGRKRLMLHVQLFANSNVGDQSAILHDQMNTMISLSFT